MDQIAERGERLVDVARGIGPVDLVEVDPVGAEAPEAVLDGADDPAAGVAARVAIGSHRRMELGGQDHVVAASGERLGDDLLGLARRVDVGGVDEVHPCVERGVDDANALVVVGVAPGPEHHRSETELADLDAGAAERAVVHGLSF